MNRKGLGRTDFKKYSGKWVALLSDDRTVAGSGRHPRTALKRARSAGEKNPILMKVPADPGTYILFVSQ